MDWFWQKFLPKAGVASTTGFATAGIIVLLPIIIPAGWLMKRLGWFDPVGPNAEN